MEQDGQQDFETKNKQVKQNKRPGKGLGRERESGRKWNKLASLMIHCQFTGSSRIVDTALSIAKRIFFRKMFVVKSIVCPLECLRTLEEERQECELLFASATWSIDDTSWRTQEKDKISITISTHPGPIPPFIPFTGSTHIHSAATTTKIG